MAGEPQVGPLLLREARRLKDITYLEGCCFPSRHPSCEASVANRTVEE
ncbi:MAG: hypothetical protein SA339_10355 [Methanomassiliicoccus sp.]|nr:hypothetical protein [Methanomassiliicoccus sp.]